MQEYANMYFKNFLYKNDKSGSLIRLWEKEEPKFIKNFPVVATTKPRRKKEVGAPKGPIGAYLFFVKEVNERAKNNGVNLGKSLPIEASAKWKTISDSEKEKYTRLAERDKERYRKEMDGWKNRSTDVLPFEEGDEEE